MRLYRSFATPPILLGIMLLIAAPPLSLSAGGSRTQGPSGQEKLLPAAVNQLLRERPLPSEAPGPTAGASARSEKGVPTDDAPIEDLIEYWSQQREVVKSAGSPGPSDIVRERLLGAAERMPWIIPRLYEFFPQNLEMHDRLYKVLTKDPKEFDEIEDNNWRVSLYWWLQSNTQYLRNELIEAVRTRDNNNADKLDEIEALARLDWHTAKPLLEKIVASGRSLSYPKALSQLYEGAMKENDTAQADIYRPILKQFIVESGLSPDARRNALESLLKDEWIGQEEWFVSLFDPKVSGLSESREMAGMSYITFINTVPRGSMNKNLRKAIQSMNSRSSSTFLSAALSANAGRWIPVIAGLTEGKEPEVRSAAVSSLAAFLNSDRTEKKDRENAARALLPWLTNPDWASAPSRADFISTLAEIDLPESIPDLLWVLDNDKDDYTRESAIEALAHYCDPRMAPAFKQILASESNKEIRWEIVNGLAKCGGFSDDEAAAAIEAYAGMAATDEGKATIKEVSSGETEKAPSLNALIGQILFEGDVSWATEGAATLLFDRMKELRPEVARIILNKIRALPLNIAIVKLVERIGNGSADIADLKLALRERDTLAQDLRDELTELIKRGGYASGIAAIALGNSDRQIEILKGNDVKAQIALLAGARYLIEKLPIELLKELIVSPDKALAQAVENYLEVEGGADARKLILARRPNELKILGDLSCLADYQSDLGALNAWEEKLRGEILAPGGVEEIFALAPAAPSKRMKAIVIRVRRGKAEIIIHDIEGNRKTRALAESEFRELRDLTSRSEMEDLGPESWRIKKPIIPYEYLHLTKEGGRRVILAGYSAAPKFPSPHEKLADIFYRICHR